MCWPSLVSRNNKVKGLMDIIHVCVARGAGCSSRGGSSIYHHSRNWCEVGQKERKIWMVTVWSE
jgi:hypothetical protein